MIPPRFRCEFYWRHFAETSAVGLRRLCLQCNCPILLLLTAFAYAVPLLTLNLKSTFSALRSFVCKSFPARTGTCWIHCCWVCCSLLFAWDIGWWFTDRKHCYNSQMKNPLHGLESSMVFEGTTGLYERLYRFNSRWVLRKKEKYGNSKKWIWRIFSLFLRSNLSIMMTKGQVWKRVWNYIFGSEIGSGFGEPGGTPSPRIHRSTPLRCVANTADRINR